MGSKRNRNKVRDVVLYVQSNRPTEDHYKALQQFYKSAELNQLSLMEAKDLNSEDGTNALLLIHNEIAPDGKTYSIPVARMFLYGESKNYRAPDGKGGWVEPPSSKPEQGQDP